MDRGHYLIVEHNIKNGDPYIRLFSRPRYSRFTRNYCTHRPDSMLPGNVKENDPAVDWHGLQRMPNHPNNGGRRLLARVSVTGLEVPVMRIPHKSGFLPTGPLWCCNMQKKEDNYRAENPSWMTRRRLLRTFSSNGEKHGQTDVCSSRSAIIWMAHGRATSHPAAYRHH